MPVQYTIQGWEVLGLILAGVALGFMLSVFVVALVNMRPKVIVRTNVKKTNEMIRQINWLRKKIIWEKDRLSEHRIAINDMYRIFLLEKERRVKVNASKN